MNTTFCADPNILEGSEINREITMHKIEIKTNKCIMDVIVDVNRAVAENGKIISSWDNREFGKGFYFHSPVKMSGK